MNTFRIADNSKVDFCYPKNVACSLGQNMANSRRGGRNERARLPISPPRNVSPGGGHTCSQERGQVADPFPSLFYTVLLIYIQGALLQIFFFRAPIEKRTNTVSCSPRSSSSLTVPYSRNIFSPEFRCHCFPLKKTCSPYLCVASLWDLFHFSAPPVRQSPLILIFLPSSISPFFARGVFFHFFGTHCLKQSSYCAIGFKNIFERAHCCIKFLRRHIILFFQEISRNIKSSESHYQVNDYRRCTVIPESLQHVEQVKKNGLD